MAELADAYGSGPYGGNPMEVQVLSPAPFETNALFGGRFTFRHLHSAERVNEKDGLCLPIASTTSPMRPTPMPPMQRRGGTTGLWPSGCRRWTGWKYLPTCTTWPAATNRASTPCRRQASSSAPITRGKRTGGRPRPRPIWSASASPRCWRPAASFSPPTCSPLSTARCSKISMPRPIDRASSKPSDS